jgi:hypothetical protein
MKSARLKLLVLLSLLGLSLSAAAQKNEVGALVGGYLPIGSALSTSPGVSVEGVIAHRLASIPLVGVYVELPVVVGVNVGAKNLLASASYSSLFITPGVKLKLTPKFPVSPYLVVGGGYARFHAGSSSGQTTSSGGAVDIGGGLDAKVLPRISLRGEVRDFHGGSLTLLNVSGITGHNLVALGGVALRF